MRRGEIYFARLNPVEGSEQGNIRPVLIIQNDVGNQFSQTTIVAAITGKKKRSSFPTHVPIFIAGRKYASTIMLEQIRTIDKSRILGYVGQESRILGYVGQADDSTMKAVNIAIAVSLGFYDRGVKI